MERLLFDISDTVNADCYDEDLSANPPRRLLYRPILADEPGAARAKLTETLFDSFTLGLIVLDGAGRVDALNRSAKSLLDEQDGLVVRDGVLTAVVRAEAARLRDLIGAAGGGLLISRAMRRPLPLLVAPIRAVASNEGRRSAVCVSVADPERGLNIDGRQLSALYALTERESAVAALLMEGCAPLTIAEKLGTSLNTVRTHIRHLLEKTRTTRLTELVCLLLKSSVVTWLGAGPDA